MIRMLCALGLIAVICSTGMAQQPNVPNDSSLVFAGVDGPPFPLTVSWGGTVLGMDHQGQPGSPFLMAASDGSNITAGSTISPGIFLGPVGILDIDVTNGFTIVLDGFAPATLFDLLAVIDPTGQSSFTLPVPASGHLGAFQSVLFNNAAALTLTAASDVTVSSQQTIVVTGGDDVGGVIPLVFGATHFYDTTYTGVGINSNSNVTLGGFDTGFAVSATAMESGLPRIAGCWVDTLFGATLGGQPLIGVFTENAAGWAMHFTLQRNYFDQNGPNAGILDNSGTNTHRVSFDYASGNVTFDYTAANTFFLPPVPGGMHTNWGVAGITPGGNLAAGNLNAYVETTDGTGAGGGPLAGFGTALQSWNTDDGIQTFAGAGVTTGAVTTTFSPAFYDGLGQANTYIIL